MSVLKSLAVFCKLYTKRCISSPDFARITWSSQKVVSNFKFLLMVTQLRNVGRHFEINSFICILSNRG